MKIFSLLQICFFILHNAYAQKYSANTIPSQLKYNANAIIRNSITNVNILAEDKMVVSTKQIITVLNTDGDSVLNTYLFYGDDSKISNISLTVLDDFGKEIKHISKSKFIDISAADGFSLYNDDRVKYAEFTPSVYPYTAILEYEFKTASTALIPRWHPIIAYNVSVQQSSYNVYNPKNLAIRYKTVNFEGYNISKTSDINIGYSIVNQPAIKYESYSDYYYNVLPHLLVAVDQFALRGVKGKANDWKTFGKWMNDALLHEKTILDKATINKVKMLVKDAENTIEKAKILYNYMQNKTRYVSIQIGIGGWQPMAAKDVDKLGYGDCKGLTIYMKALLDVVDIPSYYSIVYAGQKRNIDSNFASIQGNHVILNLPNKGNDLWLECTSQSLPFGFLGDFTDDRDVLVITPQGGTIKHTPAYKNDTNLQTINASITLNQKGDLSADFNCVSRGMKYNKKYHLANLNNMDLESYYKNEYWNHLNNLKIKTTNIANDKTEISLTENLQITIDGFATIKEGDYIFTLNALNPNRYIPKRHRNRKSSFLIKHGYKDNSEYKITIPEGYNIGLLPENFELKTEFGSYAVSIKKIDEQTLLYKNNFTLIEGTYPKESYQAYRQFRKQVAKEDNLRLILKKSH